MFKIITSIWRQSQVLRTFPRSLSTRTEFSHITEDKIIKGNKTLDYPVEDCFTFFSKKLAEYGDDIALKDGVTGDSITYQEILKNSRKLASYFHNKGFKQGERIGINVPNCIEYSYSALGSLANGMVLTTANPAYTAYEIKSQLNSSSPRALITNSKLMDVARAGCENTSTNLIISLDDVTVNDSGVVCMSDILQNGDGNFSTDLSLIDPVNDVAFMLYSSGTTGPPKGVMVTHHGMTSNILQIRDFFGLNMPKDILAVLPMFHIYGLNFILLTNLYHGGTIHTLPAFDPVQFLTTIEKNQIGRICIVPPIAVFMLNHPMVSDYDLSSVTSGVIGAAPMDEQATNAFKDKFPNMVLQQGYGMTESNITHTQPNDESLHKPGSCGQVYSDIEFKIVDIETGEALGPNEKGEVCTRGRQIMKGYFNNEEATAATLDNDGWLYSGDLGYYDDELNLFVIDRMKELIKYKAFQVAPAELEDLLLGHGEIADCCVIGIPCEKSGELPRAYVVKKPDSEITEGQVQNYVAEYLSDHKHLRGGVEFLEQIPKSASGKLLRRVLKDEYMKSN